MAISQGLNYRTSLVGLLKELGYKIDQSVCSGFVAMLLQAFFLGKKELEQFNNRLNQLPHFINCKQAQLLIQTEELHAALVQTLEENNDDPKQQDEVRKRIKEVEQLLDEIKNKTEFATLQKTFLSKITALKTQPITAETKVELKQAEQSLSDVVEMWAFLDGIALQQNPFGFSHLFPEHQIQSDHQLQVLALTQSIALEKLIPKEQKTTTTLERKPTILDKIAEFSGTYDLARLETALLSLPKTTEYSIFLESVAHDIAVCFDPLQKVWVVGNFDEEYKPVEFIPEKETKTLAHKIIKAFSKDAYATFSAHFLGTQSNGQTISSELGKWIESQAAHRFSKSPETLPKTEIDAALFLAARRGNAPLVKRLLEIKANPNIQYRGNNTALISAAYFGHIKVAELLLQHVTLDTSQFGQALIAAATNGHESVVKMLLVKNSTAKLALIPSKQIEIALKSAKQHQHQNIVTILENHLATQLSTQTSLLYHEVRRETPATAAATPTLYDAKFKK